MKLLIKGINKCENCPHYDLDDGEGVCSVSGNTIYGKVILDSAKLPEWCPLPEMECAACGGKKVDYLYHCYDCTEDTVLSTYSDDDDNLYTEDSDDKE